MNFSTNFILTSALLRPHKTEDKNDHASTLRSPEFYRQLGLPVPPEETREEEAETWIQRKMAPLPSWAIEVDGKCIGSTRIHSVDPANRRGRFAIEIFNADYWGRGIGGEASRFVVKVAFEELALHRLELLVFTVNERAIRCYESCGFRREGVKRDTVCLDGVWYSDLVMSILEDEYRG